MKTPAGPRAAARGGGRPGPGGILFELTGGRLCLDLANTVDCRPTPRRRDLLARYDDLVAWGEQSGAIGEREGRRLLRITGRRPAAARAALARAVRVREAIFDIFSAVARGAPPPARAIGTLNRHLPQALGRLRIGAERGRFSWRLETGPDDPDRVLHPVLRSAADLLTGGEIDRVRICASDACAWLFLDSSRNRTRRWCDMSVCGNRAKARRHYARLRRRI